MPVTGWEAPGLPQQVWLPVLGPVLRALAPPAGKIRNELSVTVQCQRLQEEAEEEAEEEPEEEDTTITVPSHAA